MDRAFFDRWMPASGIVFVVLAIVAFIVIGDFPAVDDPAEDFAAFYQDERGRILAGAIIFAVALYALIWFAGAVAARLRDIGEPRLAAVVLGGGVAFAAMSLAGIGMFAAIAHSAAEEVDAEVVKGLDTVGSGVDIMSAIPFAALVFAFGVAVTRTGIVARWFGPASMVVSLLIFLGATTWARDGFWAPYGGYTWIMVIALFLWVLVASALLISRPPESRVSRAQAD